MQFRKRPLLTALVACAVVALSMSCGDDRTPTAPHQRPAPPGANATLWDGSQATGNPNVFFLPPLVANPVGLGNFGKSPFQDGLPVEIEIQCLSAPTGATCANRGLLRTKAKASVADGQYMLNWDTRAPGFDPGFVFRIKVWIVSQNVAFADVLLVPNGNPKNRNTSDDIPLPDGRTLPIKVRIQEGWNCVGQGACVTKVVTNTPTTTADYTEVTTADGRSMFAAPANWFDPAQAPNGVLVTVEDVTSERSTQAGKCSLGVTKMLAVEHCVRFVTDPRVTILRTALPVVVATCVDGLHRADPYQLIKYDAGERPEFLRNVAPPAPFFCAESDGTVGLRDQQPQGVLAAARSGVRSFARAVTRMLTPTPAYAVDQGIGGALGIGSDCCSLISIGQPVTMDQVDPAVRDNQSAAVGSFVANVPKVRIVTVHGSAVGVDGQPVTCSVPAGEGLVGPNGSSNTFSDVTKDGGYFECPWRLGATPGQYTLTFTADNIDHCTPTETQQQVNCVIAVENGEEGTQILTQQVQFTATATDAAGGGDDIVVVNDINVFMESMSSANNQRLVRNLVTFTNDGARNAGTKVWFDQAADGVCNTRSETGAPVYTCGQTGAFDAFRKALIAGTIQSVVDVSSSDEASPLSDIPSDVKVVVLLAPQTNYSANEINSLRRFALAGGRIVLIGENTSTVYGNGLAAENDLLSQFNGYIQGQPNSALLSGNNSPVGASSILQSPITAGLTGLLFGGAGALQLPVESAGTPLIVLDGNVLMAVAPIFDT